MKHRLLCGITLLSAIWPAGSPAAELRKPAHPWVVDFADHQCLVSREYGTAEEPLSLRLKPSPIGDVMQLSIVQKSRGAEPREASVSLVIDGGHVIQSRLLAYDYEKAFRVIRILLPLNDFAPIRNATQLSIRSDPEIDEGLELTVMPALMQQIDICLADLQEYWNIAPTQQAKLKRRATGNLARFVHDRHYPGMAVWKEEEGTVGFVLLIDQSGKVADCSVTESSKVPVLDSQTCAVMSASATVEPAIGADGKPARDAMTSQIRWVMAKEDGVTSPRLR